MPSTAMPAPAAEAERAFAEVGIRRAAAKRPPDYALLANMLLHPIESVRSSARQALGYVAPMLMLEERWLDERSPAPDASPDIPRWIRRSGNDWAGEGGFIDVCVRALGSLSPARLEALLDQLSAFPGLRRTLPARLLAGGKRREAWIFARKAAVAHRRRYQKQLIISPTLLCQLHCPYCVSAGVTVTGRPHMPLPMLEKLLAWAAHAGVRVIYLTGGEPTLYPHMAGLLKGCRRHHLRLCLATNGLLDGAVTGEILRARPVSVTLHLTPEVRASPSLLKQYRRTARALVKEGLEVILRCNITSPADQPGRYINHAVELGIKQIRLSLPLPNLQRKNSFVALRDLRSCAGLIDLWVAESVAARLDLALAKPFPLCWLAESSARSFIANRCFIHNCPIHAHGCSHNMVVYPDLSFSPCLALNRRSRRPIIAFPGLKSAAQAFRARIEQTLRRPLLPACRSCPLAMGGRCIGACLSYRSRAAHRNGGRC